MKKALLTIIIIAVSFLTGWFGQSFLDTKNQTIKKITPIIKPRPLDKYTIRNLSKTNIDPGRIEILETMSEEEKYTSYLFSFEFDPALKKGKNKKTTGQINIPKQKGKLPLIFLLRGYVDKESYQTGIGTKSAASYFAKNGFITIAPDFLGYAESDLQAKDVMEARFQTYTTTISLIGSLNQIEKWDKDNIFIWGHSNGGQIALTTLEITKKSYPTTLWAPVSKPFPYSILYYTDELEDRGKFLRKEIAKFEETYNPDLYSLDLYLDKITAPLQIHQGLADDFVPFDWSSELAEKLKELEKDVNFYLYQGNDHNLRPSWDTVIARDLAFFKKHLADQK